MTSPSQSSRPNQTDYRWTVQTMEFFIVQPSPLPLLIPLGPKYSPQEIQIEIFSYRLTFQRYASGPRLKTPPPANLYGLVCSCCRYIRLKIVFNWFLEGASNIWDYILNLRQIFLLGLVFKPGWKIMLLVLISSLLKNQNSIQEEMKCRLKAGNSCYYSVQSEVF